MMTSSSGTISQVEPFPALLALCAGNSPVTSELPAQRPVTRSFDVFLVSAWINGWLNSREAGGLRRHCVPYDVIVMFVIDIDINECTDIRSPKHLSPAMYENKWAI